MYSGLNDVFGALFGRRNRFGAGVRHNVVAAEQAIACQVSEVCRAAIGAVLAHACRIFSANFAPGFYHGPLRPFDQAELFWWNEIHLALDYRAAELCSLSRGELIHLLVLIEA